MRLHSITRQIKSLNYSLNKKSYYPGAGCRALGGPCGSKGPWAPEMTAQLSDSESSSAGTWERGPGTQEGLRKVCLANGPRAHLQANDATEQPAC